MPDITVPTYSSDGSRLRRYTLAAIERLEQLNLVAIQRNRKGKIVCAHFRNAEGANPIRTTAHVGSKYSYREKVGDGLFAWSLKGLPASEHEDADLFVRGIFRNVALSCMKRDEPTPAPSKVVSIDAGRKRRPAARPIEFDSERRAA